MKLSKEVQELQAEVEELRASRVTIPSVTTSAIHVNFEIYE
jgi:hypothetical protein